MGFYKRKDRKDTWRFEYYDGYKPNGKKDVITKNIKAKTEREAKRLYNIWVAEIELGKYQKTSKISLQNFINEKWIPLHGEVELEPNTLENYKGILNNIFLPNFGAARLEDIKTINLQELFIKLGKNRKPATIQRYKVVISNVLSRAVEWGYLKNNPVTKVKVKGSHKIAKKDTFTINELKEILSFASREDLQWTTIVHLALFCGLRRSEILGLTWNNIDFSKKVIRVSHSLTLDHSNARNQLRLKPTKSSNVRFVPFNNKLHSLLRELYLNKSTDKDNSEEEWYNDENFYVISTDLGKPFRPDSVSQRWSRFRDRYEIRSLGFHYLRHSCATFLHHNGVDLKTISLILGHANISITADLYTHVYDESILDAADVFDKLDE